MRPTSRPAQRKVLSGEARPWVSWPNKLNNRAPSAPALGLIPRVLFCYVPNETAGWFKSKGGSPMNRPVGGLQMKSIRCWIVDHWIVHRWIVDRWIAARWIAALSIVTLWTLAPVVLVHAQDYDATARDQVIALEKAWNQAYKAGDTKALSAILDNSLILVEDDGSLKTKSEFLASVKASSGNQAQDH